MQAFEFARTSIYESSFKLFLFAELVCKICKKEALYESRFKLFLFAEQSPIHLKNSVTQDPAPLK
jgi:hypothetical protein